jgi:D-alanyl-D-alanine carboxypeptidase/D-alanyl-D-alanine-endopeptidase (penicillin-binding protein 4)
LPVLTAVSSPPSRPSWVGRTAVALTLAAALTLASCGPGRESADVTEEQASVPPTTGATSVPTTPIGPDVSPACPVPSMADEAPPVDLVTDLAGVVDDPRLDGRLVSLSITVEGWGEVLAVDAEQPLLPASNQKLLTAMGALEVLPGDGHFETLVVADGPVTSGTLDGDLVLVGGGDPTLSGAGLDALADQVAASGVGHVTGALVVDESRYESRRAAPGWLDWQRPAYVGSLSALIVDENRYRSDPAFLDDPALGGAERFVDALARRDVVVHGPVRHGLAPAEAPTLATRDSDTFDELIASMLTSSDNMIAEALVREVGLQAADDGSTAAGLASIRGALDVLCVPLAGSDDDGSGLSRANGRSAGEWRALLDAARRQPWGAELAAGLPVAGRSGTLAGRLRGGATAGNVTAKTGSIVPGRALSGYATTAGGREVVFSLVVNGEPPVAVESVLDALITTVVAHPG